MRQTAGKITSVDIKHHETNRTNPKKKNSFIATCLTRFVYS